MSSKPKYKNSKRKAETYESEDGFVSNDDGNAPKSKKTKTTAKSTSTSSAEPMWELDRMKRATISNFKGNTYINIREYYEKDGEHLPGKKGIMLNLAAYTALAKAMPEINKKLRESGHEIDLTDDGVDAEEEGEGGGGKSRAVVKKAKAEKKKAKKANIEATSEEEEEEEEEDDDD